MSVYSNTNIDSDYGIDATTFTAFATYSYPSGKPSLLSSATAKLRSLIPSSLSDQVALVVYQITETQTIWTDSGSGADRDFSSHRANEPSGYFSLGDIGVGSHYKPPFSIVVRARKSDALVAPTGFRERWTDRGSGARRDVAFYEPICPSGYRVLGYVTVASYSARPSTNDIRCVKSNYVVQGQWKWVWNDAGSGADRDVTVWEAIPSEAGQGVRGMSAVPCHCGMDRTPYVLNPAYIQYIISKPVQHYYLTNLEYKIDARQILGQEPQVLARTTLINNAGLVQEVSRQITYSYEETYTWSHTTGLEIGVSITVTAGVPQLASTSVSMFYCISNCKWCKIWPQLLLFHLQVTTSVTAKYSYTTGGSHKETKTDSTTAKIRVQPRSSVVATITSKRYTMDVPFRATVTPQFTDGSYGAAFTYEGVFEGVQVNDVTVTYSPDVPIP